MISFKSLRHALLMGVATFGATAAVGALEQPAYAQEVTRTYNIPAQDLNSALREFALQTGRDVLYPPQIVAGRRSNGAQGQLTERAALEALLAGTGLQFEQTASNGYAVQDPTSPTQLGAASDAAPSEEIIVTAQKREERLRDVPVPVSSVNAEALTTTGQLRLQDYYNETPGLGLTLLGNGSTPIVTIRGVTTGGGTNPTVGVVVDGVPYGNTVSPGLAPTVPDIDPGDLARVEVLRGPQGTLYGASSMGGLLNFATISPSTEGVSGRIQVGTSVVEHGDTGHNLRGAINFPLSSELAVRLSAFTVSDPGYVDNISTNAEDVNGRESNGGRLAVLWQPSDAFSLHLSALLQESERLGTSDVDPALGEFRQAAMIGTGTYGRSTEAYSLIMDGAFGGIDWTSATGYSVDDVTGSRDATTVAGGFFSSRAMSLFGVSGAAIPGSIQTEKFSQELRFSIPIGDRIDWLIGAFYTDEDLHPVTDTIAANPATGQRVGLLLRTANPSTYEERALFTNLTFTLTDRFDIQVGARYAESEQSFHGERSGPLSTVFFGSNPSITPTVSSEDNAFTYLLTPRFRLSPDLMLYARIASGYRPGGPNASCGVVGVPCQYDPDRTVNYELGAKGSLWNERLSFDVSLYSIDWEDIQIQLQLPTFTGYTDNAGAATSEGIELSLDAHPTDGLNIRTWFAWNDAKLSENFPASSQVLGRAGDRLPYSSEYSANLSVDQEFPFWNGSTAFVGGSVSYVGDREGSFQTSGVRETFPSYTQVDLHGGVRFDDWTLNLFINNVTDERGVLRAGRDSLTPTWVTFIDPRSAGVSLTADF